MERRSGSPSVNALAVIGVGNELMADEGVGPRVIRILSAMPHKAGVDLIDAGAAGLRLVHLMAGRRAVILIDCALMGTPPGTIRRFVPEEARSRKAGAGLSLHEADILDVLRIAAEAGEAPGRVVIFGIEPARVTPGLGLSEPVAEAAERCAALVREELGSPAFCGEQDDA